MTIETVCFVCGKEEVNVNGLCYDCTMNELFNPGAAFASTFGALEWPVCEKCGQEQSYHVKTHKYFCPQCSKDGHDDGTK